MSGEGRTLELVEIEKDLGIQIVNTLNPTKQSTEAANKASSVSGSIRKYLNISTKTVF